MQCKLLLYSEILVLKHCCNIMNEIKPIIRLVNNRDVVVAFAITELASNENNSSIFAM